MLPAPINIAHTASTLQPSPSLPSIPVLFSWSGGKDSALALCALRLRADVHVTGLLTTVTEGYDRVSMHGVRQSLLRRQAAALALPLHEVGIPPECSNPANCQSAGNADRVTPRG